MTEKEALREGYQSDIHHTNLSLGSGPASREAPEVVWSVHVCVLDGGSRGDTTCTEPRLQGEGEGGLLRCPGCHGTEWMGVPSISAGGTICFFRSCLTSICAPFFVRFSSIPLLISLFFLSTSLFWPKKGSPTTPTPNGHKKLSLTYFLRES